MAVSAVPADLKVEQEQKEPVVRVSVPVVRVSDPVTAD